MKAARNMGALDRLVRLIVAVVIALLYFTGTITGPLGVVLGIFAVIFVITSVIGTCPLYMPFGICTCQKPPAEGGEKEERIE
jgi:hypothetical protein